MPEESDMSATISLPRVLEVGGGALGKVPALARQWGLTNPLVVSDPFLRDSGKLDQVTSLLTDAGVAFATFTETVSDPTVSVVEAGAKLFRDGDHDSLIAFGGGSPIDTAKAINLLACGGGTMRDYMVPNVPDISVHPLMAIPTTAGTGSEATKVTIITDEANDEKMLIMGPACQPLIAVVDYTLTFSIPRRTTADTGIDSLTHAIEAYVSRKANAFTDALALSAMKRINTHIHTACTEPDNATAREQMMLGATEAGMAFSNASVCLVHGMSRPLGAFFHVPHGLSNAMLLPDVTAFSAPAALARYAKCARTMGVAKDSEGDQAAVAALVDHLRRLNSELDVPSPKAWGIDEQTYFKLIPTMAAQALASGSPNNNPLVPSTADIQTLYETIWAT